MNLDLKKKSTFKKFQQFQQVTIILHKISYEIRY